MHLDIRIVIRTCHSITACHDTLVSSLVLRSSYPPLSEPPFARPWQKTSEVWSSWSPDPTLWRISPDFYLCLCRRQKHKHERTRIVTHACIEEKYIMVHPKVTNLLGTLKPMVSYGSAANKTYWYRLSGASTRCSYLRHNQQQQTTDCASETHNISLASPTLIDRPMHVRRHESVSRLQAWFDGRILYFKEQTPLPRLRVLCNHNKNHRLS